MFMKCKYVGSNIIFKWEECRIRGVLTNDKENMDNLKCANCKCFSKNKNAKDGTCQKWKARCGGQRVNSEDFCSDFEKKIDKD